MSGVPFVGVTRHYGIASGYNTAIFNGDAVKLVTGGTVELDTADAAMTPIGIFLGCSYTDPTLGYKVFSQYYPASTVASDIEAYVADGTDILFKAVVLSSFTSRNSFSFFLAFDSSEFCFKITTDEAAEMCASVELIFSKNKFILFLMNISGSNVIANAPISSSCLDFWY